MTSYLPLVGQLVNYISFNLIRRYTSPLETIETCFLDFKSIKAVGKVLSKHQNLDQVLDSEMKMQLKHCYDCIWSKWLVQHGIIDFSTDLVTL